MKKTEERGEETCSREKNGKQRSRERQRTSSENNSMLCEEAEKSQPPSRNLCVLNVALCLSI